MDSQGYTPMVASHEGPNPYRPYYRPPSIGERISDPLPSSTPLSSGSSSKTSSSPSFGSSARDMLSDLNYNNILGESASSTSETLRALADQAVWKYSSVFMAQPFEVAKMVLQVRAPGYGAVAVGRKERYQRRSLGTPRSSERGGHIYRSADEDEEDDDDEPSYFTSTAPQSRFRDYTSQSESGRSRSNASRTSHGSIRPPPVKPVYKLELRKPDALLEVLGQSWAREGAWGVWKGTNVTFLYGLLLKTIETWTRSMFSALLNLPDPGSLGNTYGTVGGLDILDSPAPLASLGVAVIAAGVAGLLLSPLDIVRTRVMLTSISRPPRAILPCLRNLRSWICPTSLIAPTLLHSTLPTLISSSTPLFLRSNFHIDPVLTPTAYSVCTFASSVLDLFVTLPFETILRRGQIQTASQAAASTSAQSSPPSRNLSRSRGHRRQSSTLSNTDTSFAQPASSTLATVVDVGPYTGVLSTLWRIVREEGEILEDSAATTLGGASGTFAHKKAQAGKKGQGVAGLWRGWRVGMWGLIGVWGAAALNTTAAKGGEF